MAQNERSKVNVLIHPNLFPPDARTRHNPGEILGFARDLRFPPSLHFCHNDGALKSRLLLPIHTPDAELATHWYDP